MLLRPCELDALIPAEHAARTIWRLVEMWDLENFYSAIRSRGEEPGRSATDPKLLIGLWLYAYTQGVGNGRELCRQCEESAAYIWMCGGVAMNYHTLNDFRVNHGEAIDGLLTQMIGTLLCKGLVKVERIGQDGTRIRAGAGRRSFKKRPTLEVHLKEAKKHVEAVKRLAEDSAMGAKRKAAMERSARERENRLAAALAEMQKMELAKAQQKEKPSKENPPKASETDPEARLMRMPDGGVSSGYNVQFATATEGRAIVGVEVTNAGSDVHESVPMRKQVEERSGCEVKEHLMDGGYVGLEQIDAAGAEGVTVYAPLPKSKKEGVDPHAPKKGDSQELAAWRARMGTQEAKEIYKQRASTSETVNAEVKTFRGLRDVLVRGIKKVKCLALWSALAYNAVHFASRLTG